MGRGRSKKVIEDEGERDLPAVFLLVLRNLSFVDGHVKLRRAFTTDDGETFLGCRLVASTVQSAVLVLSFDVEDVL